MQNGGKSSMAHTVLQAISLYTPLSSPSIWRCLAGDLAGVSISEPGIHASAHTHTNTHCLHIWKLVFTSHAMRMAAEPWNFLQAVEVSQTLSRGKLFCIWGQPVGSRFAPRFRWNSFRRRGQDVPGFRCHKTATATAVGLLYNVMFTRRK